MNDQAVTRLQGEYLFMMIPLYPYQMSKLV